MNRQFNFTTTDDGSPTVRVDDSEAMHSLRGAFSETVYIYGSAIEECLKRGFTPRVLSLGLGLGYVEILSAAFFRKYGVRGGGESFELLPELRSWFFDWARSRADLVPPEFCKVYDAILERTAAETGQASLAIRAELAAMLSSENWRLNGPLSSELIPLRPPRKFGCICFDAFSNKTSPDLWTEEFLSSFFSDVSAPGAVVSTYACTGALKRSLRTAGYDLDIRAGFANKRESTFAIRDFTP